MFGLFGDIEDGLKYLEAHTDSHMDCIQHVISDNIRFKQSCP